MATASGQLTRASRSLMVIWREPGFADDLAESSLINVCLMSMWNFMLKGLQRSKKSSMVVRVVHFVLRTQQMCHIYSHVLW